MTEVLTFLNHEDCANRVEKRVNAKQERCSWGVSYFDYMGMEVFFWRTSVTSGISMRGELDALNVGRS